MSRLALFRGMGLVALAGWAALAWANPLLGLSDPTRPPPGLIKAAAGGGGAATPEAASAPEAARAASAPAPEPAQAVLVLQLVRVDAQPSRSVALINGQLMAPGARIEGWTLVSVAPNEAFLQGPRGRLRLSLTGEQVIENRPKSAQSRRGRKE